MSWLKSPSSPGDASATVTISSKTICTSLSGRSNGAAAARSRLTIRSGEVSPSTPSAPVLALP